MTDDLRIPIIEEEARVTKRATDLERVTVRVGSEEERVVFHEELRHEHVEVTRVPVKREVGEAPIIRTEGDLTIVPVLEERLVVEKRLFLVEELHLRRVAGTETIDLPTTLRRTRIDVERQELGQEEND
jgi:stress response protein YsnF